MKQFVLFGVVLMGTACAHFAENKSAAGIETHNSFALGLVSISKKDTTIGQKDCEEALTTYREGEKPLLRADVYSPCFTVGMMDPTQHGQLPPPMPRDLNGDGKIDFVQYPSGHVVPAHLYGMFPGTHWPTVYNQYGIMPEATIGLAGQQLGHLTVMRHRGYVLGHPGDPLTMGTPDEIITRSDLDAEIKPILGEIDANATDIIQGAKASEGAKK
jgi:hypothetical protein